MNVIVEGGYDFVDSRDVVRGILLCEEKGRKGECYILNGEYISIRDMLNYIRKLRGKGEARLKLPLSIAKLLAPAAEKFVVTFGKKPPTFTPYSVETLNSNGNFSHEKATRELGYEPMDIRDSIRDTINFK